jgi:hypothetical protein
MRTVLIVLAATFALGSTAAAKDKPGAWSGAHRSQYRALKRQVRQDYRALKRTKRQRPLNPVENKRFTALKEARGHFTDVTFKRVAAHGTLAAAGGMLAAELTALFRGNSGPIRMTAVSVASLGLSVGPGYSLYQDGRRSRARGIVQARRAGVPVSGLLQASARRTLLQEAQAKRDLAQVMSRPSLNSAARVTEMADSLR